jgi:hypothetical protein
MPRTLRAMRHTSRDRRNRLRQQAKQQRKLRREQAKAAA